MRIKTSRLRQIIREEIKSSGRELSSLKEATTKNTVHLTKWQLMMLIEAKVGAGKAYLEGPEADFQKTLASLTKMLRDLPIDTLQILRSTDPVYDDLINKALDGVGITDKSRRDLIYKPLKMMIPVDIAGLPRT